MINSFLGGYTINPYAGGRNKAAFELTRYLVGKSHEVFLFPWNERLFSDIFYRVQVGSGFGIVKVLSTVPPPSILRFAAALPRLLVNLDLPFVPQKRIKAWAKEVIFDRGLALSLAVDKIHPDVIHTHHTHSDFPFVYRKLGLKPPIILSHQSPGEGSGLDLYDFVVFPSEDHRQVICRKYPSVRNMSKVIYNSVDSIYLDSYSGDIGEDIIFIGVMSKDDRKGLEILLRAYAKDPSLNKWRLVVIGDGPMRPSHENFVKQNKLNVYFAGRLSEQGNVDFMRKARLFVMPSKAGSLSIAYTEALCAGLPIIGYPPNVEELGRLLKMPVGMPFDALSNDYGLLAYLIKKMMSPESGFGVETRQELARRAKAVFSLEKFGSEYTRLYQELNQRKTG